jgi:acyl-CoA thioester hydrolase
MKNSRHTFTLGFEVRDYECDQQGIVNNAIYQHYLEHARHQFLKRNGLVFAQLNKEGIYLVVVRAEIDYKAPLRGGDAFEVGLTMTRLSPVRVGFLQDIHRLPDRKLMVSSKFVCAAMNAQGRPIFPKVLEPLL